MPNVLSTVAHPPATAARRRRDWRSVRLLIPALLLLVIFFLLPVLSLLLRSVLEPSPGLHNYAQLVGSTDYLRVFITHLRKKIEPNPAKPKYILTEPWLGYRFADEERRG